RRRSSGRELVPTTSTLTRVCCAAVPAMFRAGKLLRSTPNSGNRFARARRVEGVPDPTSPSSQPAREGGDQGRPAREGGDRGRRVREGAGEGNRANGRGRGRGRGRGPGRDRGTRRPDGARADRGAERHTRRQEAVAARRAALPAPQALHYPPELPVS